MVTQISAGTYGSIMNGCSFSHLTTIKGNLSTALFSTTNGLLATLRTAGSGSKILYFRS